MKKILTILASAILLASEAPLAAPPAGPDMNRGANAMAPSFEQIDTNGDGQITPDEADLAGVTIDWGKADPSGKGSLNREEYDQAVQEGYVQENPGAAPPGQSPMP
jgi:hypothetical protein